jgi:hypothetical protein
MTLEDFENMLDKIADNLPPESDVIDSFYKYSMMDQTAILNELFSLQLFRNRLHREYASFSMSGMSDIEIGKALIPWIEFYYPRIIAEVSNDDKLGDKFRSIIMAIIAEIRSGSINA